MNRIKISLILVFVLMLNFIFCPYVKAEEFSDLDDIIAVWDPNLDTSWDTVFNEYKILDPQTRDKADTVIASNMFRFLMSVGSKPKGKLTQTDYSNFVKATSPFYIAYNGITSAPEVTVHAAWSISSDAFKIFCANVIHNLAQQSTYYDTHVLKNDNFLNDAGKGHLNFIYNDNDYNINIANNIFNNYVLSSTSSAIDYYFNPTPLSYNGVDFSLSDILSFKNAAPSGCRFTPFIGRSFSYTSSVLYCPENDSVSINGYINTYNVPSSNSIFIVYSLDDTNLNGNLFCGNLQFSSSNPVYYSFNFANLINGGTPSFSSFDKPWGQNYFFNDNVITAVSLTYTNINDIISAAKGYFSSYIAPYCVYADSLKLVFRNGISSPVMTTIYDIGFPNGYSFSSPQFVPVNIYNNQVYTSSDDTYWFVDTMVDNIINNDYSTVNNGTDNSFYINNYYVPDTVSSGGIQLVTSSSIVYNYTTIINNNGTSSGGSIGSYPYPFDVRIINPEDLQNETELNIKNDILNNYDIDLNAGDINSSINIVKDTFNDKIRSVAPSTGGAMSWGPLMFSMIPSDWSIILWSFIIIMAVICVYHHRK